jgi:hypothetical protein
MKISMMMTHQRHVYHGKDNSPFNAWSRIRKDASLRVTRRIRGEENARRAAQRKVMWRKRRKKRKRQFRKNHHVKTLLFCWPSVRKMA